MQSFRSCYQCHFESPAFVVQQCSKWAKILATVRGGFHHSKMVFGIEKVWNGTSTNSVIALVVLTLSIINTRWDAKTCQGILAKASCWRSLKWKRARVSKERSKLSVLMEVLMSNVAFITFLVDAMAEVCAEAHLNFIILSHLSRKMVCDQACTYIQALALWESFFKDNNFVMRENHLPCWKLLQNTCIEI